MSMKKEIKISGDLEFVRSNIHSMYKWACSLEEFQKLSLNEIANLKYSIKKMKEKLND
jgi:hypothetical protein